MKGKFLLDLVDLNFECNFRFHEKILRIWNTLSFLPKGTIQIQGIPAFRDFTIRDSRYFVIPFH